jgi:threonine/homoserine/homoserine lactone efflux protein
MLLLVHLVPLAVALAVSSVPIMVTIFILLSTSRSRAAMPFLIGWVLGIVLAVCLAALLSRAVPTARTERHPDTAVGIVEIIVGVALLALALFGWFHPRAKAASATPGWLRSSTNMGPWTAVGLGLILNARPKSILLAIAAGLSLHADADQPAELIIGVLVYTIIAASTVAVPIIATTAAPARMEPQLVRAHDWLGRNGHVLTCVILALVGVFVVVMGIERLQ